MRVRKKNVLFEIKKQTNMREYKQSWWCTSGSLDDDIVADMCGKEGYNVHPDGECKEGGEPLKLSQELSLYGTAA